MDAASRAQAIIAELEKFKDHLKDITRTTGRIQKTVIVDAVILCLKEGIAPPTAKIIARAATTLSGQPRGAIKKAVWDTRELYQRWSTAQERHFPTTEWTMVRPHGASGYAQDRNRGSLRRVRHHRSTRPLDVS